MNSRGCSMCHWKRCGCGDSGRRTVPRQVLQRAREVVADRPWQTEWLSLDELALELGVHQRTLRAAARTGRLTVWFSSRSVFGRPIRYATRGDGQRFKDTYYRLFGGQPLCPAPLPIVPADYDEQLRRPRSSAGALPGGARASRRRCWQSRGLPVGVPKAHPLTGLLATGSSHSRRRWCVVVGAAPLSVYTKLCLSGIRRRPRRI